MSTYFEFIPIELLEIIIYFIVPNDINNFLVSFNSPIKESLLQVKENTYQALFKEEFPNYYNNFSNLLKYNHKYKWENMYNEMDKVIPQIIIKNKDTSFHRSKLDRIDMWNDVGLIKYPSIFYEVLFYEDFKDMYIKLDDYLKDLSNSEAWYYLYTIYDDMFNEFGWVALPIYHFYIPLLREFGKISTNDNIFEILSSDLSFFNKLKKEYNNNTMSTLILSMNDVNYNTFTVLFKWFIKKLYSNQHCYLPNYISAYVLLDNEEMVKWLLETYISNKVTFVDINREILDVNEDAPEKYKELIKSYLS